MHDIEFLLLLLLAIALLAQLAGRLRIPYPVFLVCGGLAIALIPRIPRLHLQPGIVFLVFLPPLLYAAAFGASPRDLRAHAGRIALLAIALVVLTVVVVAAVARVVLGELSWPMAFVLGAVLAPTDPVAATSVFRRTPVRERVAVVVEGEALVNDGVGLTLYRTAVGAATAGTFSLGSAALDLVLVAAAACSSASRSAGRSTRSSAACRSPRSRSRSPSRRTPARARPRPVAAALVETVGCAPCPTTPSSPNAATASCSSRSTAPTPATRSTSHSLRASRRRSTRSTATTP